MKVLIDTCIIIDALQSRKPFQENAETIFIYAANKLFDAYITAKAVTDIYYLIHRSTHSDTDTREMLSKILSLFEPLDTAGTDCVKAIPSDITDYEDAVMVQTALRCGIDCIITRNIKDFTHSPVKVYEPGNFISLINKEKD